MSQDSRTPYIEYDEHGNAFERMTPPDPDPDCPRAKKLLNDYIDPKRHKRNCGRTGPTTNIGRAISSHNATRHGMCAQTLILTTESEDDWNGLLSACLTTYQNPAENSVLFTFVLKTAQAEWFRLRIQREYDLFYGTMDEVPIFGWQAEKVKEHDLILRYLTAAERKFQREYRILEHHFKTHPPPAKPRNRSRSGI